jgi:hypothetical protein
MNISNKRSWTRFAIPVLAVAFTAGCAKPADKTAFDTPEEAVEAMVAALQTDDVARLQALLGPGGEEIVSSGDPVADENAREGFLAAYQAKHSLAEDGADTRTLVVGENEWPLPVPIVRRDGKWILDGAAGADEMIYRRVGRNELGAIDVCRGFVSAQLEYASAGRDGDPAGIYALKLLSDPGLHNGLYWETAEGEPPSPAGPFVAAAAAEGYRAAEGDERTPYHGYYYRMLYAQGPNANGGAKDYFKDGVLTEGFALIAWPADYGSSGVQTFKCNQDGVVFQRDLGEDTATVVESIKLFDPDSSWVAVVPPDEPPTP